MHFKLPSSIDSQSAGRETTTKAKEKVLEWCSAAPTGQRDWNCILPESGSVKGIMWVPDTGEATASKTSGAA